MFAGDKVPDRIERQSDLAKLTVIRILSFVVLTFLITWSTGTAVVLSSHAELVNGAYRIQHPIPLPFPIAILFVVMGGWAPGLAALILSALESGRTGVRELLRQFRRWRVLPIWYLTALLGPALLGFIALLITAVSGGATPAHWFSVPSARLMSLAVGPWGEELGWRGYAQPKLQQGIGAFAASLVVGTIWSCWHYWPVLTPAGGPLSEFFSASFATWLAYELANSVMMAWVYNSTGGSLPIAWAAHAGLTLGQTLVNKHPIPFGSFVLVFWAAAALVVVLNGPRTLARCRQLRRAGTNTARGSDQ
jgi:membrane protease YdiL (CAAX protease family)